MNLKNSICGAMVLLAMTAFAPLPAIAQDGFAREGELEQLREDLSGVADRVQQSVDQTMVSMENLQNYTGDERTAQATALLDSIEAETREIIEQIRITSPFMSALDDARATVLVLLRKNERDPPSPSRDARVAALTAALASIDEQSAQIIAAEGTLTSLLADHAQLRTQIERDGEVRAVQLFVADLSTMASGLEDMATVLSEISSSVVSVPTEASLATD